MHNDIQGILNKAAPIPACSQKWVWRPSILYRNTNFPASGATRKTETVPIKNSTIN